jgi:hypothetical protein
VNRLKPVGLDFEIQFDYFLNILDTSDAPVRVPSPRECLFCNIGSADCPERMADTVAPEEEFDAETV